MHMPTDSIDHSYNSESFETSAAARSEKVVIWKMNGSISQKKLITIFMEGPN